MRELDELVERHERPVDAWSASYTDGWIARNDASGIGVDAYYAQYIASCTDMFGFETMSREKFDERVRACAYTVAHMHDGAQYKRE